VERRAKLKEISDRAFRLRYDFIRECPGAKKHGKIIKEFALNSLMNSENDFDSEMFLDMIGLECSEDGDYPYDKIAEMFDVSSERVLLVAAYCRGMDFDGESYWDYDLQYDKNEELDTIYDFLVRLGYELSDDENAMRDGTHELFVKDEG